MIRPRYPMRHLANDCPFIEEIRQELQNTHCTCFVVAKTPTGTLVGSRDDLDRFYPELIKQLGKKSPKD